MKSIGERSIEKNIGSYPSLAKKLMDMHPGQWKKKPRALEMRLRNIDQGNDSILQKNWVLNGLEKLLDTPQQDILECVARAAQAADPHARSYKIPFFPKDTLDLNVQDLWPGYPPILFSPNDWKNHWWRVRSGWDAKLVGEWLKLRKGVHFVTATSWDHAYEQLPEQGFVFLLLDVDSADVQHPNWEIPRRIDLLVACHSWTPHLSRSIKQKNAHNRILPSTTPPLEEWICVEESWETSDRHRLIEWIRQYVAKNHLTRDGDDLQTIFTSLDKNNTVLRSPRDVLFWAAIWDSIGSEVIAADDKETLTKALLDRNTKVWSQMQDQTTRNISPEEIWNALFDARMSKSNPDDQRFSLRWWGEKFREDLPILGESTRSSCIRTGQQLFELGLLEPEPGPMAPEKATYRVGPHWLEHKYFRIYLRDTFGGKIKSWSSMLLTPDFDECLAVIYEKIEGGEEELLKEVLRDKSEGLQGCIAFEACFRMYGLFLLLNKDNQTDGEMLTAFWNKQSEYMVSRWSGHLPFPTFVYDEHDSENWKASHAAWLMACLAISQKLEAEAHATSIKGTQNLVFQAVTHPKSLTKKEKSELSMSVGNLFDALKPLVNRDCDIIEGDYRTVLTKWSEYFRKCHEAGFLEEYPDSPVSVAWKVVDAAKKNEPAPFSVSEFCDWVSPPFQVLEALCKIEEVPVHEALKSLWETTIKNDEKVVSLNGCWKEPENKEALIKAAPPEVFGSQLYQYICGLAPTQEAKSLLHCMNTLQWHDWLSVWQSDARPFGAQDALKGFWDIAPDELIDLIIDGETWLEGQCRFLVPVLVRRRSEQFIGKLVKTLASDKRACETLRFIPEEYWDEVLRKMPTELQLRQGDPSLIRWLHQYIEKRHADWDGKAWAFWQKVKTLP